MKRATQIAAWVVVIVCLFGAAAKVQERVTAYKSPRWLKERMSYLPESDAIEPYLLGFSSTFANYLWIRTTLYFGSHYASDRDFSWLIQMVDMVTELNPYFYPAYEFAGLLIPEHCNNPDAARAILARGITYLGDRRWKLYFYMGMVYYLHYGDKKSAADYFAMGAQLPSPHQHKLVRLATSFYRQSGAEHDAREFLRIVQEAVEDPMVKRVVAERLGE